MRKRIIIIKVIGILLAALATSFIGHNNSRAEDLQWSTIGSGGILDEASTSKNKFYGGVVAFRGSNTGTLELRYPIPKPANVDALDFDPLCNMTARIRDDGRYANVKIFLEEYDIFTGTTNTVWEMDSDWVPASPDFQTIGVCMDGFFACKVMDFSNKLYYLRVMIKRTNYTAKAEFGGIMFNAPTCVQDVEYITRLPTSQCLCP